MDLDIIWEKFFNQFKKEITNITIEKRIVAGLPFVYVETPFPEDADSITEILKIYGVKAMRGKRLSLELVYVRSEHCMHVYRMRFLVPQEKMFCCGNLCFDCIRFRNS